MRLSIKNFSFIAVAVLLAGCYSAPMHKKGVAIAYKRVSKTDPEFIKANYGETPKPGEDAAVPPSGATVGAVSGAAVVGGAGAVLITTAAAPLIALTAVGATMGAAVGAIGDALTEDTDCGPGFALFTFQSAEGDIKTIRAIREFACGYQPGDVVNYSQNETGIFIMKK